MKFTVNKKDIIDVLSKIQGLTGHKGSLTITETVLITASDTGISLTATDLETGFEGTYPAVVETPGSIAINAKKLYEIVKNFPVDNITIEETENNWIAIGNDKVEYNIVGMSPDDFPDVPKMKEINFLSVDSGSLKTMIDRSLIICSSGDTRAHIKGVLLETTSNIAKMVSTDGARLSVVNCTIDSGLPPNLIPDISVLIPKKALSEVSKFLSREGSVQIGVESNNFVIKKDRETFIVRLLEGEFPDYRAISEDKGDVISFDKKLFLMMMKRMSIMSSDIYRGAVFNFIEDRLTITTTNPDIGESKEKMDIEYKKEPIEVSFNVKYFAETLHAVESERVNIQIISAEGPCKIEGEDDKSFISVIMPINL